MHRAIAPTPDHDAFWIFALWRALHGGQPTLADVAAAAIASLSQFLPAQEDSFGLPPLPVSPYTRAISEFEDCDTTEADAMDALPDESDPHEPPAFLCNDPPEFSIHQYYFNFKGVLYRLDRPAFACLPTAA